MFQDVDLDVDCVCVIFEIVDFYELWSYCILRIWELKIPQSLHKLPETIEVKRRNLTKFDRNQIEMNKSPLPVLSQNICFWIAKFHQPDLLRK